MTRTMCKALSDALTALRPMERRALTVSALDDYRTPEWLRDIKVCLAGQLLEGTEPGQVLDAGLAETLDALDPVHRRTLTRLCSTDDGTVELWTGQLMYGVVMQLEADEWRTKTMQASVLAPLEADLLAEVEAISDAADWSHVPAPAPRTEAYWPDDDDGLVSA